MKFDWTVKKIDFMKEFSTAVKEQGDLVSTLEDFESCLSCTNCAFFDVCSLEQSLSCRGLLKTVYKEYREKFEKETTTEKIAENTKEKMLVFIELGGDMEETLRVTADQYKVIKHLAECGYFDEDVRIYTEETLENNLTDLT